LFKLIDLIG
jgi:hypothetical protein